MQEEPAKRTPADIEAAMQEVEDKSKAFTEAHKGENADDILSQMRGEEPVSIWHDKGEEPDEDRQVLINISGYCYVDFYHKEDKRFYMFGNPKHYLCEVDRWAYASDLLKLSNVERTIKNWKEPVSEDLKTELNKYIKDHFTIDTEQLDRFGIEEKDYMYSMDKSDMLALVEYFTNWQKEQFEKNRLAACDRQTEGEAEVEREFVTSIIEKENRQPTFDDAIKYGMRLQKEQMMAKAVDGEYWDNDIILEGGIRGMYDDGNKVKVIVIKED